jgi:hypothetical protein
MHDDHERHGTFRLRQINVGLEKAFALEFSVLFWRTIHEILGQSGLVVFVFR